MWISSSLRVTIVERLRIELTPDEITSMPCFNSVKISLHWPSFPSLTLVSNSFSCRFKFDERSARLFSTSWPTELTVS